MLPLAGCAFTIPRAGPPLTLGQRVRVYVPASDEYVRIATLVSLTEDSIVFFRTPSRSAVAQPGLAPARTTLPLGAVGGIEVSRGMHRHVGAGLTLGFLAGAFVGVLACEEQPGWGIGCYHPDRFYYVFVPAVVLGTALGLRRTERWEAVSPDDLRRIRVGLVPQSAGRIGLGVRVGF